MTKLPDDEREVTAAMMLGRAFIIFTLAAGMIGTVWYLTH